MKYVISNKLFLGLTVGFVWFLGLPVSGLAGEPCTTEPTYPVGSPIDVDTCVTNRSWIYIENDPSVFWTSEHGGSDQIYGEAYKFWQQGGSFTASRSFAPYSEPPAGGASPDLTENRSLTISNIPNKPDNCKPHYCYFYSDTQFKVDSNSPLDTDRRYYYK